MKTVKTEGYDEMAAVYQCLEIARLNETLKQHGVSDLEVRKAICTEYFFSSGNFLDQGWFKSEDKTLWPELNFAERPLHPTKGLGDIKTLYLNPGFSFHEYASGDIYWYFDERNEDASEIETGSA